MNEAGFTKIFHDFLQIIPDISNYIIFVFEREPVTVKKILIGTAIVFITYILSKISKKYLRKRISSQYKIHEHTIVAIERVVFYFILVTGIFFALRVVHIPLSTFAFLGGALAVGFGFGAKELITDFISGFIIIFEKPIKLGDLVYVDDQTGRIADIGIRCTRIHNSHNLDIMLPNSAFLQKKIINWTRSDNTILTNVTIGIILESDIHKATDLMLKAVESCKDILKTPKPFVLFKEYTLNSIVFEVYFSIQVNRCMEKLIYESNVNYALNDTLRNAGITIASSQTGVLLETSKPIDLNITNIEE